MSNRRGGMGGRHSFDRPRDKKAALARLGRYLLHFKWPLLLAVVMTLASNVLSMVGPKLSGAAIDAITDPAGVQFDRVGYYAGLMLLFYLLSSVLSYLLSLLMVRISRRVTLRMRRDMFERIADMPVKYVDTHPIGDIISRVFYDTDTINTSLSSDVVSVLTSAVTVVGSLVMMHFHYRLYHPAHPAPVPQTVEKNG